MIELLSPTTQDRFTNLLTANTGRICAFIFTLLHDYDATQEVMQEVSMVLWRKFDSFDASTDFAVWAMSVARLSVFEWRRTQKRVPLPLDDGELGLLADEAEAVSRESDERKVALRKCLGALSEPDRAVLALRYEKKRPVASIAHELELTNMAVYKRLNKMYSMLLDCIRRRLHSENEQ